jgi:hypothetical protein
MPPTFRLRPGTASDLPHAVRLYDACLGSDKLVALLFPRKEEDPESYKKYLYRLYAKRYWSVEWTFTFVVKEEAGQGEDDGEKEEDAIVGFSCWKRPSADVSFRERWFTLCKSSSSHSPHSLVFPPFVIFILSSSHSS